MRTARNFRGDDDRNMAFPQTTDLGENARLEDLPVNLCKDKGPTCAARAKAKEFNLKRRSG
jgi:hypothetical protein